MSRTTPTDKVFPYRRDADGRSLCRVCGGDSRGGEWFCRRCLEAEIARRNGEGDEP